VYCSDAHRAEARRRRLLGRAPEWRSGDPIADARQLILQAAARLDAAERSEDIVEDAVVAEARVKVTEELLRAQQLAADAARRAADAERQLRRERGEWVATHRALAEGAAHDAATIAELTGALDGARSELEEELVRHHRDVEALDTRLQCSLAAQTAVLVSVQEQAAAAGREAEQLRQQLGSAMAALADAERRLGATEQTLGIVTRDATASHP